MNTSKLVHLQLPILYMEKAWTYISASSIYILNRIVTIIKGMNSSSLYSVYVLNDDVK